MSDQDGSETAPEETSDPPQSGDAAGDSESRGLSDPIAASAEEVTPQEQTPVESPDESRRHEGTEHDETDSLDGKSSSELREDMRATRARHARALEAEAHARAEIEDMCLRIEKHFQSEKAARTKAEELMQQAIEGEISAKSTLEEQQVRMRELGEDLESDREKLTAERDALEGMRIEFEAELQAAQAELASAQGALQNAEERVRAAEAVEKQKIIADYEQRLIGLSAELARVREDMAQRTVYMTREMQRYQAAAVAMAAAMAAAKREMGERRKDVDSMRVKMDSLMDRLLVGHEANVMLQAHLGVAQEHAGQLFRSEAPGKYAGGRALAVAPRSASMPPPAHGASVAATEVLAMHRGTARRGATQRAAGRADPTRLPPVRQEAAGSRLLDATASSSMKKGRLPAASVLRSTDRFGSIKTKNENLMAATMANW